MVGVLDRLENADNPSKDLEAGGQGPANIHAWVGSVVAENIKASIQPARDPPY